MSTIHQSVVGKRFSGKTTLVNALKAKYLVEPDSEEADVVVYDDTVDNSFLKDEIFRVNVSQYVQSLKALQQDDFVHFTSVSNSTVSYIQSEIPDMSRNAIRKICIETIEPENSFLTLDQKSPVKTTLHVTTIVDGLPVQTDVVIEDENVVPVEEAE